jgi:predicted nucleic acid-binding protein
MAWVFDASIAIAWCIADENTPETEVLLDRLESEPAFVPNLWHLEIANVLTMAMRKKARLSVAQRTQFLESIAKAHITVDSLTWSQAWTAILSLADQYQLTTYDAAYLELAMRLGVELATLDADLRKAAIKAGVKVIP